MSQCCTQIFRGSEIVAERFPDPKSEIRMMTLHSTRGANYWSRLPVTRMDLAIGAYENISSADVPRFTQSLAEAMPGLRDHRCSIGEPGGFITRLKRGTYCAHIVEHVALELQGMIGHEVGYGRTRGGDAVGEYLVIFEHLHEAVRTSPPWIPELDYLQKEMRPIAELCTGEQSHLFVRGLTLAHFDAVLKQNDEARRFLAGNIQAELASHGVEAFVHAAA